MTFLFLEFLREYKTNIKNTNACVLHISTVTATCMCACLQLGAAHNLVPASAAIRGLGPGVLYPPAGPDGQESAAESVIRSSGANRE